MAEELNYEDVDAVASYIFEITIGEFDGDFERAYEVADRMTEITKANPSGEFRKAISVKIREKAQEHGLFSGLPQPIDEFSLVLAPQIGLPKLRGAYLDTNKGTCTLVRPPNFSPDVVPSKEKDDNEGRYELINKWYSWDKHAHVFIFRDNITGKSVFETTPLSFARRLSLSNRTMSAAGVWTLSAERRAMRKLKTLVNRRQWKMWVLTGMFTVKSKRSKLTYLIRKLRPVVVLSEHKKEYADIISVRCLHPQGYYQGTFAGTLCPTDDAIAHLLLIRTDEVAFWKRSNSHQIYEAEAGL